MIRVALAQLNSNDDIKSNLKQILKLIEQICSAPDKPELILFPENSLFFRMSTAETLQPLAADSEIWQPLKEQAIKYNVHLHLTTALIDVDKKTYNGSVLIRSEGSLEVVYRKIHLFDIALTGQKPIRESDGFHFGAESNIFEINGFKFGSSICYDIRFSELYAKYAKAEVDVILVPSAFLVKTGEAHWHVLLRARAIESQCYVLAAAQSGEHHSSKVADKRQTYGHTLAIGPWGEVIAEKSTETGFITVEISKAEILRVRTQIPMKSHRRL